MVSKGAASSEELVEDWTENGWTGLSPPCCSPKEPFGESDVDHPSHVKRVYVFPRRICCLNMNSWEKAASLPVSSLS